MAMRKCLGVLLFFWFVFSISSAVARLLMHGWSKTDSVSRNLKKTSGLRSVLESCDGRKPSETSNEQTVSDRKLVWPEADVLFYKDSFFDH